MAASSRNVSAYIFAFSVTAPILSAFQNIQQLFMLYKRTAALYFLIFHIQNKQD
ncbi:hypothetical protein D068_cds05720 [Bacillus atrophaeus UCMB-5137]|jgi:hypothetical protein|nr:hypothetical protein D068_cds05720 [Bacillus atrophaeus UCMB-5137]